MGFRNKTGGRSLVAGRSVELELEHQKRGDRRGGIGRNVGFGGGLQV